MLKQSPHFYTAYPLKSRKDAIKQGDTVYFTGKPCRNGHIDVRYLPSNVCRGCLRTANQKWVALGDRRENFRKARNRHRAIHGRGSRQRLTAHDSEEIREFYSNCPRGYQVDHIIPLKGKIVSGLHVLANLQYLPTDANRRKKNKVHLETLESCICPVDRT